MAGTQGQAWEIFRAVWPHQNEPRRGGRTRLSLRGRVMKRIAILIHALRFLLALLLTGFAIPHLCAAGAPANADWATYLGDKQRSHYSPLRQINRSNVAQL